MSNLKNIVGANVRKRRVANGMSQDALAARLQTAGWDISRAGLSKIEAGLRLVIDAEVMVLSKVLLCTPLDLLAGVNPKTVVGVVRQGHG
jgi:transcriptional regulator with XRE-family HTH domain